MYNLDKYIADYLVTHKELSAQGIGEFTIVEGQAVNGAPLVEFTSNKNSYTTEALIHYVAEQEGKNKIVTGFDLESHFNQIKQFINIGTPWVIPGLGQLQHGRNRELQFIQQEQTEHDFHERIKRKQAAADAHHSPFETTNPATEKAGNTGTIVLTLFIILALGAGGYYFYANRNSIQSTVVATDTTATVTDTVVSVPSSSNMNNTATAVKPPMPNNAQVSQSQPQSGASASSANGFRFVLNRTSNAVYALKRFNQLKLYGTKVYLDSAKQNNASVYKIYLVKDASPADTARLRDSLTRYYGKPVKVEAAQ